jgi:nitroreductase
MLADLIRKNRSYRRFEEDFYMERKVLEELVDLARLCPSGGNLQQLRFFLSGDVETNLKIFPCLAWAGYLKDWNGPIVGERPSAYIVVLAEKESPKAPEIDVGIAAQSILLGAVEKGLGGCMIGSVKREKLCKELMLPAHLKIVMVIALGKVKEEVMIDDLKNGDVKYWCDEKGVHHVPKRKLNDLLIN